MQTYEELMMPLFLRLGGAPEQLHMDQPLTMRSISENLQSLKPVAREEASNALAANHLAASRALEEQVLAHVYAQPPQFFERLIIDLLLAMGYANRRRDLTKQIGCSHDGGVDGILSQDLLGLDVILLQAKRFRPSTTISSSQIRDFIGSLETRKASKGIFVTTASFSAAARSAVQCASHRVRLIDGSELSALMVRHNIGVRPTQSFVFKTLDPDYFSPTAQQTSMSTPASSHPRK